MRALKRFSPLLLSSLVLIVLALSGCQSKGPPASPGVGETVGVTDTTIKIGALLPISNTTAAAWGIPISQGEKAFFDYINDQGGIYGRKLELDVGDSQYTGPVASETIRKLVEQDGIFALQGSLGTEAHLAVYKYLEEKDIPDMWILTGDSIWTDPVAHNRFGYLVDYTDEGRILGRYIGNNFNGKKVGILIQNDGFGQEGEKGLKMGIADTGATMTYANTEQYDASQTDVSAQISRLKADGVDVVAFYGMPAQAAGGIKYARETLGWDVPFVITGVDAVEIVGQLAGYDNIEGTVTVVYGHQAFESDWPGIKEYTDILAKYAPDASMNNLTLTGMAIADSTVSVLRQTGRDLTRSGFLAAAESTCNFTARASIAPSSTSPTDHRPIEVEEYVRATVDESNTAHPFTWQPFGDVMTFESTKDCVTPTPPADFDSQPH
ncbi:MAG: ABC transporter substrate-binding protein [Dehalococcoidia bacterium]